MSKGFINQNLLKNQEKLLKYLQLDDNQLQRRLTCLTCKDLIIEPYQSECGRRTCYKCLNFDNQHLECDKYPNSTNCNYVYDKSFMKEISNLSIKCINKGCKANINLKELKDHLEVCKYGANNHILKTKFVSSEKKCHNCKMKMEKKYKENHRNIIKGKNLLCDSWKCFCPFNCGEKNEVVIKKHLKQCPEVVVECVMKEEGCKMLLKRKNMFEHFIDHLNIIKNEIFNLEKRKNDYRNDLILNEIFHDQIKKLKEAIVLYKNDYLGQLEYENNPNCLEKTFIIRNSIQKIKDAELKNETKVYLAEYTDFFMDFFYYFSLDLTNKTILIEVEKKSEYKMQELPKIITFLFSDQSSDYSHSFETCNKVFLVRKKCEVGSLRLDNFKNVSNQETISFKLEFYSIPFAETGLFSHNL